MNQLSDEVIWQEIRYLDPELNEDREFLRIRKRNASIPLAIRLMFGVILGTLGMDVGLLILVALHKF